MARAIKEDDKSLDKNYQDAQLASYWNFRFKESMVAKSDYTKRWQMYWDAYNGDYFKGENVPDYKSDLVSNYVFSTIETIRPVMLDNDPKFQAMPRHPDGVEFANDLQDAFSYEWDREKVTTKLYRELITALVTGTAIFFTPWDSVKKEIKAIPVSPFNIFVDPLATSVDDAGYIIYARYTNVFHLKSLFPNSAENLSGGNVNYSELVHDNDKDSNLDNQVLVLEVWTRDDETFEEDDNGSVTQKYPNGRVLTICPELGVVLSDKHNPYSDKKFPFHVLKDYDIPGKFWGEGEIAQLLSPQKYMNELNNAIIDNAKATANMPWIVDKNSGIGYGKITNRPGLVIRKNPGTDVKRDQPPSMPSYVPNAVEALKGDIEQVSGIFNSVKGTSETGVYTAQGILALQEAGQARIRLKVKILEDFLGELAYSWFNRMKQFWKEDRWIRISKPDGSYDFREFTRDTFDFDYDVKIMAGSTMQTNRGAMLDLMVRLAQTVMPDGQALVDREAVVEYLPAEVKSALLGRMQESATAMEQQIEELTEAMEQISEQLEQITQESTQNDEQTFDVIDEITSAIEKLNTEILQLKEEHDRIVEEQKKEEERAKIRDESYNEGFSDAERMLETPDVMEEGDPLESGLFNEDMLALGEGIPDEEEEALSEELDGEIAGLPDDLLQGLEELSDDELALLLQQNPQLADLIR